MTEDEKKYKNLHERNYGYQNNNWMLDQVEYIRKLRLQSILEIGCGNGRFLYDVSHFIPTVIGVDLVRSPLIDESKYKFYKKNVIEEDLPFQTDLVVSADVMEHFKEEHIPSLIRKFLEVSDKQMHIIACYDDGHSHETIKPPEEWLKLFNCISEKFRIRWIKERKGRDICCISNFED